MCINYHTDKQVIVITRLYFHNGIYTEVIIPLGIAKL